LVYQTLRGVISQRPFAGTSLLRSMTICGPADKPALSIRLRTAALAPFWHSRIWRETPTPAQWSVRACHTITS
jgi:hypothetical protein